MQFQKLFYLAGGLGLLFIAHRAAGWPGVAAAGGGLLMWLLLHFTRLMSVLKRAANRPIGYVDSAVMLNAKLKPGVSLMHVIAMTRSLGERTSDENVQPEVYRWRDNGDSTVTAQFLNGKLQSWSMHRPNKEAETAQAPPNEAAAAPESGGPTP